MVRAKLGQRGPALLVSPLRRAGSIMSSPWVRRVAVLGPIGLLFLVVPLGPAASAQADVPFHVIKVDDDGNGAINLASDVRVGGVGLICFWVGRRWLLVRW